MTDFDRVVDELLAEEFEESPVNASGLGLTEYDDRLDDLSAEAFDRRQARAAAWGLRFAAMPDVELTPDERIDLVASAQAVLSKNSLQREALLAEIRRIEQLQTVLADPVTRLK